MQLMKVFLLIVGCIMTGCSGHEGARSGEPAYAVGVTTLQLMDSARMRPQKVTVWYPAADIDAAKRRDYWFIFIGHAQPNARYADSEIKRPLLLLSHGYGGGALNLAWLAEAFASRGYIVVGVDHWLNMWDKQTSDLRFQMKDRPADLSFVLTQILQDSTWGPHIDSGKIGAAGHSFGGYTVIALAGAHFNADLMNAYCDRVGRTPECSVPRSAIPASAAAVSEKNRWYDSRIKAVYAMAPAVGQGVEIDSLETISVPVRIVATSDDEILPPSRNAEHYTAHIPNAQLSLLPDGGHFVFISECTPAAKWFNRFIEFDYCGLKQHGDRADVHAKVIDDALNFFHGAI